MEPEWDTERIRKAIKTLKHAEELMGEASLSTVSSLYQKRQALCTELVTRTLAADDEDAGKGDLK